MIKVVETYKKADGKEEVYEREFTSKKMFLYALRKSKSMVLPSKVIYELTKKNKAIFQWEGVERKIEIFDLGVH